MLFLNSLLAGLYLITLVLAYDIVQICKDAPKSALRCCDASSWTRCHGPGAKVEDCRPVPFAGNCANNKLNITHQGYSQASHVIGHFGITRGELVNPDSFPLKIFESPTGLPVGTSHLHYGVHHAKRGGKKTTIPAKTTRKPGLPTRVQKNLGLSNVPQTSGPPKACQVIGNVVLDRCDYDQALFDHWLGDDPCDYGCPKGSK